VNEVLLFTVESDTTKRESPIGSLLCRRISVVTSLGVCMRAHVHACVRAIAKVCGVRALCACGRESARARACERESRVRALDNAARYVLAVLTCVCA